MNEFYNSLPRWALQAHRPLAPDVFQNFLDFGKESQCTCRARPGPMGADGASTRDIKVPTRMAQGRHLRGSERASPVTEIGE